MIEDVAPHVKAVNVGSQGGLVAVRKGIADIAGTHLLSASGEYNLPFVRE
jgi:putative molybdopterin biosynthesis protein